MRLKKFKFPFVSRKKYDNVVGNYHFVEDARRQLNRALATKCEENNALCERIDYLYEENAELKKENKILKATLTRNGISYKRKDKNDK